MSTDTAARLEPSSVRVYRFLLFIIAVVVAFAFLGSRGLYDSTEGRYAEAAREMLETGNYLEPTLNYRPHWTKPPLTYWAIAGGMRLLGENEWGARLHLGVAFVLAVLAMYLFGKTLWGEAGGLMAGLMYATCPFLVMGANALSTDMLLTLWELAAILCYFKARASLENGKSGRWVILMWVGFGAAFLTKGPPGLLPLVPLILWHSFQKPRPRLVNPLGLVLFAGIGLSWYAVVMARNPGLLSYFIGREVGQRVFAESDRNPQWYKPFSFYLPALTAGLGAWFYYTVRLIVGRDLLGGRRLWAAIREMGLGSFLLLWLLIPLAVFFAVKSRLPLYVLPLVAPVVLATAGWMLKHGVSLKKTAVIAVIMAAVLVSGKGIASRMKSNKDMRAAYQVCKKVEDRKPLFIIVQQDSYHGLQFYLKQRVWRSTTDRPREGYDERLRDTVARIAQKKETRLCAFLVKTSKEKKIAEPLKENGIPFERFEEGYWAVLLVNGGGK